MAACLRPVSCRRGSPRGMHAPPHAFVEEDMPASAAAVHLADDEVETHQEDPMTQYVVAGDAGGNPTSATCTHLDTVVEVTPSTTQGCEDCLREGTRWVHLRECLACGHVGCCDNSPRRHATAHWNAVSHPIIRSVEPDE